MTTDPMDTEALRRLADAAAPGPWHYIPGGHDLASAGIDITAEGDSLTWDDHSGEVFTHPDAEFIAAARTAVPALLDRLAAAEHRATRAEAQSEARQIGMNYWRESFRESAQELDRAEARIRAVEAVLDDLAQQPADQIGWDAAALLPDLRHALGTVTPPRTE